MKLYFRKTAKHYSAIVLAEFRVSENQLDWSYGETGSVALAKSTFSETQLRLIRGETQLQFITPQGEGGEACGLWSQLEMKHGRLNIPA